MRLRPDLMLHGLAQEQLIAKHPVVLIVRIEGQAALCPSLRLFPAAAGLQRLVERPVVPVDTPGSVIELTCGIVRPVHSVRFPLAPPRLVSRQRRLRRQPGRLLPCAAAGRVFQYPPVVLR